MDYNVKIKLTILPTSGGSTGQRTADRAYPDNREPSIVRDTVHRAAKRARENNSRLPNGGQTSRISVSQPLGGLRRGTTRPDTAETAARAREVRERTRTIAKGTVGGVVARREWRTSGMSRDRTA